MRRAVQTALFTIFIVGIGCDGSGLVTPGASGIGTIGPEGGTVRLGNVVLVEIPAGALSSPTTISITEVATPANLGDRGAFGRAFRFQPEGLVFDVPVEVSIFVDDDALEGRPLDRLSLLSTDAGTTEVEILSGVRVESASGGTWIRGRTSHFSVISPAVLAPNRPPTVDLGEDRTIDVGEPVDLVAVVSDPDGDPLSIAWAFESRPAGSAATLSSSTGDSTSFVPDLPGDYRVRATVTDERDGSAAAIVTITASDPPVADAGDDRAVGVGSTVTLDGRRSTGAGLTFSWSFLATPGAAPTLQDADRPVATFTAADAGEYVVELTVSDGLRADRDTVSITAVAGNNSPTVSLSGPAAVLLGSTATVTATASDPDGDAVTLTWSLQSPAGSSAALVLAGSTARFTPDVPGSYLVRAVASDGTTSAEASAQVFGNPAVAGTYDTVFEVLSASGCQGMVEPGQTTGAMPVEQPTAGEVVLDLPSVTSNIRSRPRGTLEGTFYFFSGTVLVGNDDQQVNANGTFRGTMDGSQIDLTFRFTAFTCTVTGTIKGTRI